jgi:hypothetical protein
MCSGLGTTGAFVPIYLSPASFKSVQNSRRIALARPVILCDDANSRTVGRACSATIRLFGEGPLRRYDAGDRPNDGPKFNEAIANRPSTIRL